LKKIENITNKNDWRNHTVFNQIRLEKARESKKRKRTQETDSQRQSRLQKAKIYKKQKRTENASNHNEQLPQPEKTNQQDYLQKFDITKNGGIENQCWAKTNINKFQKSIKFSIVKCTICQEAWPLKAKPKSLTNYVCLRCSRD
jgi:hypothetical protein